MFDFLAIGPLTPEAARRAIEKPAQAEGVTVTGDALERILAQTRCYPYFLHSPWWNPRVAPRAVRRPPDKA